MRVTTNLDPALSIFEELSVDGSLEIQIILGLGKATRQCQPNEQRRRGRSVTYFATNTQAVGGYRFWASTPSIWWRLLTFDARVRRLCSPLARATSRRCMLPAVMERSERRSLSGLAGEEMNTSSWSSALTRQVGDLDGVSSCSLKDARLVTHSFPAVRIARAKRELPIPSRV